MARILVVDDEPDMRESVRMVLQHAHAGQVDVAESGDEARRRIEAGQHYDVVVADERMPGLLGRDLLAWLGTVEPGTRRVLMSAFRDAFDPPRPLAHAFLSKPFDTQELLGAVGSGEADELPPASGPARRDRAGS